MNSTNGYHHQQQQYGEKRFGASHKDRVRRGTRGGRTRDLRDGHGLGGGTVGVRVCEQQQRPPTDFDMAYFHSYAHVGIHEEMIKVSFSFCFFFNLLIRFRYFRSVLVFALDFAHVACAMGFNLIYLVL
jgi:hypothetical protein